MRWRLLGRKRDGLVQQRATSLAASLPAQAGPNASRTLEHPPLQAVMQHEFIGAAAAGTPLDELPQLQPLSAVEANDGPLRPNSVAAYLRQMQANRAAKVIATAPHDDDGLESAPFDSNPNDIAALRAKFASAQKAAQIAAAAKKASL